MATKENRKYKDFIDYTPELIKYIDHEENKIAHKYSIILKALHKKSMTAKEIHELYFDTETEKHTCTLKTIYRYLERLDEANFVTIAGHRMTEGSRQTEKLYSRTAKILLAKKDEKYLSGKREHRKNMSNKIGILLREVFNKKDMELEEFNKIMIEILNQNHIITDKIFDDIYKNEELANLYANTDLDVIELVNIYGMFLITLLKNQELVDEIKSLFL